MINIFTSPWPRLLFHSLVHVLAFITAAGRPTFSTRIMTLAIFLQAVTFLAFTFCDLLTSFPQKQRLFVAAGQTLAIICTG